MAWYDSLSSEGFLGPAAVGFGGIGAFAQMMNAIRMMEADQRQRDTEFRLRQLARQPLDPSQFYRPMSDAEQTARMRAVRADLATRGIPLDAAYATNLVSEQMAGTESQRYSDALNAALQARGLTLRGYGAGMPQAPMMLPGGGIGDMFSMLSYLQRGRQQRTPEQGRITDSSDVYGPFPQQQPEDLGQY